MEDYIAALIDNMAQYRPLVSDRSISTIFFGGGTPSLLSGPNIATILQHVKRHYCLDDDAEITLEANPGTVEQQNLLTFIVRALTASRLGYRVFRTTTCIH